MPKQLRKTSEDNELVTKGFLRAELEKLKLIFVTRDEFLTHMDEMMGVLKAIQEDLAASLYRSQEHTEILENHEQRLVLAEKSLFG